MLSLKVSQPELATYVATYGPGSVDQLKDYWGMGVSKARLEAVEIVKFPAHRDHSLPNFIASA